MRGASRASSRGRLNDRIFDVVEGLEPISKEKNCTLSQLSLAWVMQQPGVTSPIIARARWRATVEITEDDRKRINRVIRRGDSAAPFYEAEFGPHPHRV